MEGTEGIGGSGGREGRPVLFQVGLVLTALVQAAVLAGMVAVGLASVIGFPIAAANARGDEAGWILMGGGVLGGFCCCVGLYQLAVLVVCLAAWSGARLAIYALIGVSALLVLNAPLGTLVGILTIVGCVQELERQRQLVR
jgi:hypothetical protein